MAKRISNQTIAKYRKKNAIKKPVRKFILTIGFICISSVLSIFVFDYITQSKTFYLTQINLLNATKVTKDEIIELVNLNYHKDNIYKLNLNILKKKIETHPWIKRVVVKRKLPSTIVISIVEHEAIAIAKITDSAKLLINKKNKFFKEYDPDENLNLVEITGIEIVKIGDEYELDKTLLKPSISLLKKKELISLSKIFADKNIGITIIVRDTYNSPLIDENKTIQIKLGFDNFQEKLRKAKQISNRINTEFSERSIISIDLFDSKKIFVKTKLKNI